LYTLIHVILSLVGIVTGLVVAGGLVAGRRLDGWNGVFLATTIATNATGFGFPVDAILPSHIIAGISLVVLAIVLVARYVKKLAGAWSTMYKAGAILALYFNVFVLVVQLFRRVPALIAIAPTQSEPPFAVTQLLMLVLFAWVGRAVLKAPPLAPA